MLSLLPIENNVFYYSLECKGCTYSEQMGVAILYVELKDNLVDNQSKLKWFLEFQNVLRELEQKKPQLDELVKTAENLRESPIRQHIPEKGKLVYF